MKRKHIEGYFDDLGSLGKVWSPKEPTVSPEVSGTDVSVWIRNSTPEQDLVWFNSGRNGIALFSNQAVQRQLSDQDATHPYNVLIVYDTIADDIVIYESAPAAIPDELSKSDYEVLISRFQVPAVGSTIVIPAPAVLEPASKTEIELSITTSDISVLDNFKYITSKGLKWFYDKLIISIPQLWQSAAGRTTLVTPEILALSKRFETYQATDIASANDLTLTDGNCYRISNITNVIVHISKENWQGGSFVIIRVLKDQIILHNITATGNNIPIFFDEKRDFKAIDDTNLLMWYDSITDVWRVVGDVIGTQGTSFIATWKTENVSSGSSANNQVKLPTISTGTYNCIVCWGDGTYNTITSWNQAEITHTYSLIGTYEIRIIGTFYGFKFGNSGDKLKILDIRQWGSDFKFGIGSNNQYFYGCSNLTISATDICNLNGVTSFQSLFIGCGSLSKIPSLNEWDTNYITDMSYMFNSCSAFNQPVNFNTGNVTSMSGMFAGCSVFNQSINLNTAKVTDMNNMFNSCSAFNQPVNFNTGNVTNMSGMFNGATLFNYPVNFNTINCGAFYQMFKNASAFNQPVNFNTGNVTSMYMMFGDCSVFNSSITFSDTSKVTDMRYMFERCYKFNQPVNFNTSSCTDMSRMFNGCSVFNQPINFNTAKVTDMNNMFNSCSVFNSSITFSDTSKVTDMSNMFSSCSVFNQPIDFNTVNVTNMYNMFRGCSVFNQPINFNTAKVTDMSSMFQFCVAFNSTITFSDTSKVISFRNFMGSINGVGMLFNQPVNFNTSACTDMYMMFVACTNFNQDISAFDVSNITTAFDMFQYNLGALSTINYDLLLIAWALQNVKDNVPFSAGSTKYTLGGAAEAAKNHLVSVHSWTITDGGGF